VTLTAGSGANGPRDARMPGGARPVIIRGSVVALRPARESDRRAVYEWLAESDVTRSMMGPPLFPDTPPPNWDEFCEDYGPHFFDGTKPEIGMSYVIEVDGAAVGHVNYDGMDRARSTVELDVWLRSEAVCGLGYGPDALTALTAHLHEMFGITEFIIRPSARNPRAIRAYASAGFIPQELTGEQQAAMYGPGDYPDAVVMRKELSDTDANDPDTDEVATADTPALSELGFSDRWHALFKPYAERGLTPARVIRGDRGSALVATPSGIVRAKSSASLVKSATGGADLPVTGDWVAVLCGDDLDAPLIEAVLERASAITRGDPGKTSDVQVVAANIDTVFVVHPIAEAPNLRRIERELSVAWDSGAVPVVVLTKEDLSADMDAARTAVESVAPGADVLVMNALSGEGVEPILAYISDHRTAVLVGPSGAGKSTLINALLGEQRQETRAVRVGDGRGRHTTVTRELIQMPGGGLLIDTPGLRELGLTGSEDGIASAFADIDEASRSCRFRDCAHDDEPGCAVRAAVESGALPPERLASFHKLVREAQVAAAKTDVRLRAQEERKSKDIAKAAKEYFKRTGRS
jgi:ribosome biogenesis GTPase